MIQLITLPNDNDPALNFVREALASFVADPANGWLFTGYNNEADHLIQITNHATGDPIHILDFVCHGSPAQFSYTDLLTVDSFSNNLAQIQGVSSATSIILDGCNTGLATDFGESIAQRLADATGCNVFGAKGYMRGTFAEGNEQCTASEPDLAAYPGAVNAFGRDVWIGFAPNPVPLDTLKINFMSFSINLRTTDTLAIEETTSREQELSAFLDNILQEPLIEFPALRMAPDVTINYTRDDENVILDVFANGSLVKERISGRTWKVENTEGLKTIIRKFLA